MIASQPFALLLFINYCSVFVFSQSSYSKTNFYLNGVFVSYFVQANGYVMDKDFKSFYEETHDDL